MNGACKDIDQALFRAIKGGDRDAFERLFKKYYVSLCDYACMLQGDPAEAEDVVQDLFAHLWNNREKVEIVSEVKSYLYTAVRFRALNVLKHKLVERRHASLLTEFIEEMHHTEYLEEEMQQIVKIRAVINELPFQCRTVFTMSCLDGRKYSEIAEKLNISVNTVKSHVTKAYRDIRMGMGVDVSSVLVFIALRKFN